MAVVNFHCVNSLFSKTYPFFFFFFIREDVKLYPLSTSAHWLGESFARTTTNRQTTTTTTKKQGVIEHYFGRTDEKDERKELRKMETLLGKIV